MNLRVARTRGLEVLATIPMEEIPSWKGFAIAGATANILRA